MSWWGWLITFFICTPGSFLLIWLFGLLVTRCVEPLWDWVRGR